SGHRRGRPQALQCRSDLYTEVRNHAIGDVIEIVVDVDDARQRGHHGAFYKRVGDRIARWKAAGYRNEVAGDELPAGLRLDQPNDVGDCHPAHGIMPYVAAGVKGRLERDASYRRMLDREFDDPSYFMLVDTTLDRRNDRDVQSNLREPVEGAQFLVEDVWLPTDDSIGLRFEAIELKIECGLHFFELLKKVIISGDSLVVRVEHDEPDVAGLGGA